MRLEMKIGNALLKEKNGVTVLVEKKEFLDQDRKKSTFRPSMIRLRRDDPVPVLRYGLLTTAILACGKDVPEADVLKYDLLKDLDSHIQANTPVASLEFREDRLDRVLWEALGCEGDETPPKKIVPFIKRGDITNFSPWSPKIRDSDAQLVGRSFFACPEHMTEAAVREPAVGINSRSFGYHALHLVRNNRGTNVDYLLNAKVDIDGVEYPLQSAILGNAPENFSAFPDALPESLSCLAEALIQVIEHGSNYHEVESFPGNTFRCIALDYEEAPVEVTPVTSVELIDFVHRYLASLSNRTGTTEMTIGDGNAINIGAYASNVAGHLALLTQPDPNLTSTYFMNDAKLFRGELSRLTNGFLTKKQRAALSRRIVSRKEGQLNKSEWDAIMQGLENAALLYLKRIENAISLYEILSTESQDIEEPMALVKSGNWPGLEELITEKRFTNVDVIKLAENIFSDVYREIDLSNCDDFSERAVRKLQDVIWSRRGDYV
jgi:hypothetical protein